MITAAVVVCIDGSEEEEEEEVWRWTGTDQDRPFLPRPTDEQTDRPTDRPINFYCGFYPYNFYTITALNDG